MFGMEPAFGDFGLSCQFKKFGRREIFRGKAGCSSCFFEEIGRVAWAGLGWAGVFYRGGLAREWIGMRLGEGVAFVARSLLADWLCCLASLEIRGEGDVAGAHTVVCNFGECV